MLEMFLSHAVRLWYDSESLKLVSLALYYMTDEWISSEYMFVIVKWQFVAEIDLQQMNKIIV